LIKDVLSVSAERYQNNKNKNNFVINTSKTKQIIRFIMAYAAK